MTQETDQEQRKRLAELEKDLAGFDELQSTPPNQHTSRSRTDVVPCSIIRNDPHPAHERRDPGGGPEDAARRRARGGGDARQVDGEELGAGRGGYMRGDLVRGMGG